MIEKMMADLLPKGVCFMDVIIEVAVSAMGFSCYGIDFCTLFAFVSIAISLYKSWSDYTDDKTARR